MATTEGIDSLYDALARTKVQNAKAYSACDRAAILSDVENKPGYKALNIQVNRLRRRWVRGILPKLTTPQNNEVPEDRLAYARICRKVGLIFFASSSLRYVVCRMYDCGLSYYQKVFTKNNSFLIACPFVGKILPHNVEFPFTPGLTFSPRDCCSQLPNVIMG